MEQAGVQLVAQGASAFGADMKAAEKATLGFVDATDSGSGRIDAAGQVMIGALRQVGAVAVEAFGQALRAGADFIGGSIKLAGDFEQTMSVLKATSGATDAEMDRLRGTAKALGADLTLPNTSAVNASEALLELAKAGFTVQQSQDAAKGVLQLAAAAQIDEAKAAEINANALMAFNLQAKESVFVSDLLSAASNASSVGITDLSAGYQMAGAIFSNFQGPVVGAKQALIDLTVAEALLGNAGIKGSDAGTALKQSILQLTAPSDKAKAIMGQLGDNVGITGDIAYDAQGKMRSFPEILGLTAAATKGMTDEQRNYAISTIFGADATRAILVLMEQGPDAWAKMETAVTKQGAAADLAAAQTAGYKGAVEGAKSQIETLQLTIGQYLTPVLADLINTYISPGIAAFTAWADSILSANDPLQALVVSIDSIVPGFQDFLTAAQSWIPVVQEVVGFLGDHLMPILFGIATAITVAVVPALVSAAGAFLAAAAPIVALVAAGALLYEAWTSDFLGIRTMVTQWWNGTLLPAFQQAQAWLAEKLPPAIATLSEFWTGTLQPALKQVGNFLQDKVFPILSDLVNIYIAAAIIEVEALSAIWTNVLWPALKTVWSFLKDSVIPIIAALVNVNMAILQKASEALAGLWQKVLQPALRAVGDYISGTVMPTFQRIGDYLSATFGPVLEDVTAWLNDVTGGFEGISGAVQGAIDWLNGLADSISNLKLPDWLTPGSPTPLEIGLRGIGDALQKSVVPGVAAFQGGLTTISETISGSSLVDAMNQLGLDMMAGLGAGIQRGVRGVVNIVNSTSDNVEGAFHEKWKDASPSKVTTGIGENISLGLLQGIGGMIPSLVNVIDQTGTAMINALKKNKEKMGDEIRAVMKDLQDQAESLAMDIQSAIADAFGSTASIDRQLAKNIGALKDVLPDYRQFTEGALKQAEIDARRMLDPTEGAKFFKQRSDQILEYEKLRRQLSEETDRQERQRIKDQMTLINRAQIAEINAFNAEMAATKSPMEQIQEEMQKLLATRVELSNKDVFALPGLLENSFMNQLNSAFLGLFQDRPNPWANPPATAQQMAYGNNSTSYSSTRTYSMPIYTNQSPAALQQSMAIVEAMYP